ncbi:MAG: FAD-binding oxidoreductase [Sedimenticola sp.]
MPSIKLSNGTRFDSEPGESLLDAASRASVVMAYSCGTGRCSSCKCKVIEGKSTALHEELGLSEREKADGWVLSCVRSAISDMSLEVEDLGGLTIPQIKTLPCRIHALERLATDVIKVVLRLPPTSEFSFLPGQYIDVIAQGGIRRSYSLANASAVDNLLELHIRAVPGGLMSEYWFRQAKVNDLLRLNGPLGTFFLREMAGLDLVFLATGTGIAPVKSMLESIEILPIENKPRSITVYWGGRKPSDLYWDVNSIKGVHRYVPVLSRAGSDWSGAKGYVQQVLLAEISDLSETVVYACGSNAMIHSAKDLLLTAGLPEQNFLSDAFVCSSST